MIDRVQRELTDDDVARIAATFHAWRGDKGAGRYEDVAGFCKSATLDEIRGHQHVLKPGRYVGAEDVEDDDEPFEVKFPKLVAKLEEQFTASAALDQLLREKLGGLTRGA